MQRAHTMPRLCLSIIVLWCLTGSSTAQQPFSVSIDVDAASDEGELQRIWRYFGADEPNYAYMKDGTKLLAQLGELAPKETFFRTHNLMTSGTGTPALKWGSTNIYTEDAAGNPIYNCAIVDTIFDTYIANGVRPYVQLGFMPQAMSTHPDPYKHEWRPGMPYDEVYTGWTYPPKSYEKWGELVYQWTKHCVERYGREEVETWWWQTWNEPNIGYWRGTDEEFHKLHDFAMAGVRKALPNARIGGPDTAGDGGDFTREFIRHCLNGKNHATGEQGTPLDFVSFHAKGSPNWMGSHIRMGISNQLKTIDKGFGIVAEFPQLKNIPIVIGESDPEGCAACQGSQFSYRNGTMYSSYTAASFARKHDLAKKHGVNLEGALTWAFTFEDQPYFAGFRQLASNGLAMPVLNVFRMMSKMNGTRISTTSSHAIPLDEIVNKGVRESPDVAALASRSDEQIAIMVWHYHDDDLPGPNAYVQLKINGVSNVTQRLDVDHYRVDAYHSSSFDVWRRMGSPVAPNRSQYAELEAASKLTRYGVREQIRIDDGVATLSFELPRQGVSLVLVNTK
jgi:xylan 1,4-beta-xylosidase